MTKTTSKPAVLIVDNDEQSNLQLISTLAQLEITCQSASSSNEALAMTMDTDYMLIIMKVDMPNMDAVEVQEILSWDERTKRVPFLFMIPTPDYDMQHLNKVTTCAYDTIIQPLNFPLLMNKVKNCLVAHQQEQRIELLQARYQSILETTGDGMLGIDKEGYITFANPAVVNLLNWELESLIGKSVQVILPNISSQTHWHESRLYRSCAAGDVYRAMETFLKKSDGSRLHAQYTVTPFHDAKQLLQGMTLVFTDMTPYQNLAEQSRIIAHHDQLTNLPNHVLFQTAAQKELSRCKRHQGKMAILLCSIDQLDGIRKNQGLEVASDCLSTVAKRLSACVREDDVLGRINDNTFALIINHVEQDNDVDVVASKISLAITQPLMLKGRQHAVTLSLGSAAYPNAGDSVQLLLQHADTARQASHDQGGKQYTRYHAMMSCDEKTPLNFEAELATAITEEQLGCVYEPRFSAQSESVISFNVNVIWDHPTRGKLSAHEFLPSVTEMQIMQSIDEWVLAQACEQWQAWQSDTIPVCKLSVNLSSPLWFKENRFETIKQIFNQQQCPAEAIEIKMTEQSLAHCQDIHLFLQQVHSLGVSIMVDNFGTGPQALALLQTNYVQRIALAKELTQACGSQLADDTIIHSIIELAHRLNIKIVAKCIENDHQWLFLKEQGCDEYFGYYFARPMLAEAIPAFLSTEADLDSLQASA